MGLLSSTCEKCGTDVWLFQKHPREKCWRKEAKNKVREENLHPRPSPPDHISDFVYKQWLRNHNYPTESLLYHPHNTKFTSKEGRNYLDQITFNPTPLDKSLDVTPKEVIDRGDSKFLSCRRYNILIEIKDTYPTERLKQYKSPILLDGDPHEDEEPPTAYTVSGAEIGTAHIKDELIAARI